MIKLFSSFLIGLKPRVLDRNFSCFYDSSFQFFKSINK
nr:MAG TPA: hypothetical protein [Caudoviricetes sp.]